MVTDHRKVWARARDDLLSAMERLGFPEELGIEIAKTLGSPKAIDRMTNYLHHAQPDSVEIVVDEMLAIKSEIDAWREKKASEDASAKYYTMMRNGFGDEE